MAATASTEPFNKEKSKTPLEQFFSFTISKLIPTCCQICFTHFIQTHLRALQLQNLVINQPVWFFTKCIDGSHGLRKLLLLLGLCVLRAWSLSWARGLLGLGLPGRLAAVW